MILKVAAGILAASLMLIYLSPVVLKLKDPALTIVVLVGVAAASASGEQAKITEPSSGCGMSSGNSSFRRCCSICAIENGKSVANSFGMTAQSGVPHNNRVGDFDTFALMKLTKADEKRIADLVKQAVS